jgi:hypothetical protein
MSKKLVAEDQLCPESLISTPTVATNHFLRLPDETVLHIFSYLPQQLIATKLSPVCKRFNRLCLDPDLWISLDLSYGVADLDSTEAMKLIQRCSKLRKLSLRDRNDDGELLATYALTHCSSLEFLEVPMEDSDHTGPMLEAVGKYGKRLRRLHLEGEWDCEEMVANAHSLRNLTELGLYCNHEVVLESINDDVVVAISEHCKNLEVFKVGNFIREAVRMLSPLEGVKGSLKNLSLLCEELNDDVLAVLEKFSLLEDLYLHCGGNLSTKGIATMTRLRKLELFVGVSSGSSLVPFFSDKKLASLAELGLHCSPLDDLVLAAIAADCRELTKLKLSCTIDEDVVTDVGLKQVLQQCQKLEYLELTNFDQVTHEAFRGVEAPALKHLRVDKYFGGMTRGKITEMMPHLAIVDSH